MSTPHLRRCFDRMVLVSSLLISVAACSDSGTAADKPDGGQGDSKGMAGGGGSSLVGGHTGLGGAVAGSTGAAGNTGLAGSSGSGGQLGGATAIGGTSAVAGATATGGQSTTGGATSGGKMTGGTTGSGGTTTPGGSTGSAGKTGTGGTTAPGGSTGFAGKTGTGGTTATGGSAGSGGTTNPGGTTGTGGTSATGGATGGSTGTGGTTGKTGDYGFTYRPVADKQLDYLCTLKAAGASTYVYVQMNQTGEKSAGIAVIPIYTPVLSKISVNGTLSDLANTQYDYGTGHHNDSLQFDYQGGHYKYYHSSFGYGFRSCQPMDCVISPTADGCTSARTLPEVCVEVKADGTHDPLIDKFQKCPGSSH